MCLFFISVIPVVFLGKRREMEFNKEDVMRLYGRHLFVVPDGTGADKPLADEPAIDQVKPEPPVAPEPVKAPAFQSGKLVVWKLKPQTRLALILHEEEFFDKKLTAALKSYITAAQIDTKLIGFGVMQGKEQAWDLRDMPCPTGVVFGAGEIDFSGSQVGKGRVYAVPALAALATDASATQSVQQLLASIQL